MQAFVTAPWLGSWKYLQWGYAHALIFSCAQIWSGVWPNSNARLLIVPKDWLVGPPPKKLKKEEKKKKEEIRRNKKKSIWRSHLENINPRKHTSEASICKSVFPPQKIPLWTCYKAELSFLVMRSEQTHVFWKVDDERIHIRIFLA